MKNVNTKFTLHNIDIQVEIKYFNNRNKVINVYSNYQLYENMNERKTKTNKKKKTNFVHTIQEISAPRGRKELVRSFCNQYGRCKSD